MEVAITRSEYNSLTPINIHRDTCKTSGREGIDRKMRAVSGVYE